ncbi:MAG: FtsQ-type POTRA domain-containing protein [Dehalococcoidia bacterium]|nr:FtsQ-type POTRA domain-containing protein [Dehalococcoidia bacterium]
MRRYSYQQRRRRPAPRDGQGSHRRLWRALLLLPLLAAVTALGWFACQSPLLKVTQVEVVGAQTIDPALLAEASGLKGQMLFLLDSAGAETRLKALPMVKDVSVERRWPGKAVLRVQERQPWGYWQVKDQLYVIDDEGFVLDNTRPPEEAPTIVHIDSERRWLPGERIDPNAVALAKELIKSSPRSLGRAVTGLEYSDGSGLTVILEGGVRATFGDGRDLDYKVSALYVLLEKARKEGLEVHAVDLRFGDTISFQ